MAIYVIKTPILERYEILYTMLSEQLKEPVILTDNLNKESLSPKDLIWFHFFQEIPNELQKNVIKPNNKIAKKWDSKFLQYNEFKHHLNVPEYKIFKSQFGVIKELRSLKSKYKKFLITPEFGFSGYSFLFCDKQTTGEQLYKMLKNQEYRVSKYIPNSESFGIHLIIANKDLFYLSPATRQHIVDVTLFRGGNYPCEFSDKINSQIYKMCNFINNRLFSDGYLGLVHIDFMINNEKVIFCEVNPRTAGSTPYIAASLKEEYEINFPYIEYYAITHKDLPKINKIRKRKLNWDYEIKFRPLKFEETPYIKLQEIFNSANGEIYYLNFTDEKFVKLKVEEK